MSPLEEQRRRLLYGPTPLPPPGGGACGAAAPGFLPGKPAGREGGGSRTEQNRAGIGGFESMEENGDQNFGSLTCNLHPDPLRIPPDPYRTPTDPRPIGRYTH